MKNLVSIILVTVCFTVNAQISTNERIDYNEKSGSLWMTFDKNEPMSAQTLSTDKIRLQLPQETDLKIATQKTDDRGITHYKYKQHHAGVRVEGGELLIHEKNGKAIGASGKISKVLTPKKQTVLSEEQALQRAIGSFGAAHFVWNVPASKLPPQMNVSRNLPEGELVWLPAEIWGLEHSCMAYKFDIFSLEPLVRKWVYINTENGNIELEINQIQAHNCFAETTCSHAEEIAIAESNYAGEVQIDTDFDGEIYTLQTQIGDSRILTFNGNNQSDFPLNHFTSSDNAWSDPTAVDVHWGMERAYTYYQNVHQRNSYDDNGTDILGWAHYGSNFANAFWTGSWMAFGDGHQNYSSLTSLDIVAHEFTHGVTQHSAGLIYYGESGALNESFSDIFGEIVEHYYQPGGSDWIVGANVVQAPDKYGIRNLSKPKDPQMTRQQPNTYKGEYWYEGGVDAGGVHINSGVQNHWFYLLANGGQGINDHNFAYDIEGIGVEAAAQIAYQTLTYYLHSGATYEDARMASITAAKQAFGSGSVEAQRTAEAWCAVGVGNQCASDVSCAVRDSLVLLELYDGWNPDTPMDTWSGVVLDENGCVSSVALHNVTNGTDSLPTSLSLLSELRFLHLVGCDLTGHIPSEFGQLSQLEKLYLGGNELSGTLPVELANLSNLQQLSCPNNNLSGTLPPEYSQLINLTEIGLSGNNFSGALPIEWSNLTNLLYLTLAENNLSGTLPVEWSNIDGLTILQAEDNLLSGEIPQEYVQLNLFALVLHNNQFYGTLPHFSGSTWVSVHDNRFTFAGLENNLSANLTYAPQAAIPLLRNANELSVDAGGDLADNTYEWYKDGSLFRTITGDNTLIVDTLGNYSCTISSTVLTNPSSIRTDLILESTELYVDPRPCALRDSLILVDLYNETGGENWENSWDLTQPMSEWHGLGINADGCVDAINLSYQGMTGTLPESLYNLSELRYYYFYDNPQLEGIISPSIANLTQLRGYSVSSCRLGGAIPEEVGLLTNLTHFSIGGEHNDFGGQLPAMLLNLNQLEHLDIAYNSFEGTLPEGLGNLTNLRYLNIHNNQFEGTIPESLADLPNLSELHIYSNNFTSSLPTFPNDMEVFDIRRNGFNFDDIMNNIHLLDNDFYYERQDRLPIYSNGNALYVNAGGNLADNTYIWYENGNNIPIDTIVGNKEYVPAVAGEYYCEVTNAILTNNVLKDQNLILTSEVYDIPDQTTEPVYPGDMDNNGVVNNYDALYWGLSNGYTGYARPDASTSWTPQPASNWLASVDAVNAKHQDADGNGVIDEADFQVISLNYGNTHTITNSNGSNESPNNLRAEIIDRVRDEELSILTIKISLENDAMIPISTHGIAFDLNYESEVQVDAIVSAELDFGNSWLTGGDNSNLRTVTHIDNDNHTLSFGITRGDKQNVIGIGDIGTAVVIVCEDIHFGDTPAVSRVIANNGGSMSANQIITPLTGSTHEITIPSATTVCIENDDQSLLVLPFDDTPNGLSGEIPTQVNLTYSTGINGQAANIVDYHSGLTFNTTDNLNTTEGTLEVWVKPFWNGNDQQSHTILQAGTWGGILMQKDGGNYLRFILNRWASQGQPEVSLSHYAGDWQAGEWKHIAYTWGNGQAHMYVNGVPVTSTTYTNLPDLNVSTFNIGKDFFGGNTWDGLLDELRISNIARAPQEIAATVAACSTEERYEQALEVDIRNYPNPFTTQTKIEFELLEDNPTTIKMFDITGSPVAILLNERKTKGQYSITFNSGNLPAGVYYCTISSGEYFGRQNIMIIK